MSKWKASKSKELITQYTPWDRLVYCGVLASRNILRLSPKSTLNKIFLGIARGLDGTKYYNVSTGNCIEFETASRASKYVHDKNLMICASITDKDLLKQMKPWWSELTTIFKIAETGIRIKKITDRIDKGYIVHERKSLSKSFKDGLFARDGYICQLCGHKLKKSECIASHIKAHARGGQETEDNLLTACKRCNDFMGTSNFIESALRMGLFNSPCLANPKAKETIEKWDFWSSKFLRLQKNLHTLPLPDNISSNVCELIGDTKGVSLDDRVELIQLLLQLPEII